MKPAISVVVPVYNSQDTLPVLADRLHAVLSGIADEFELIFVNDGSADQSWSTIVRLARDHSWVRGFNLMRNYGQHNALLCGIRAAVHPVVVTMDDDLQHPPEELPALVAAMTSDVDVVYGVPEEEQHGLMRDLASRITKIALRGAMGAEHARHASAYRAFRTRLRDAFASYRSPFVSIDVMLTWGTRRFSHVLVRHSKRPVGESNYTVGRLLIHAANMATGFSVLPLQVASIVGFTFTAAGLASLTFVIVRYLISGSSVPGFPFLAAIISIFAGAQLFALGVIGEYLARMHFRMMDKPAYVVLESHSKQAGEDGSPGPDVLP